MVPTEDPVPASAGSSDDAVWLVSFGDDDDRELPLPQIAEALRRGEISGDTIVWREGLADWVALSTVPDLAKLMPTTGETANAPAAIPRPPASAVAPTLPIGGVKGEPAPTASRLPLPRAKMPSASQLDTGAEAPKWKGSTRLGLPKAPDATSTAPGISGGKPGAAPRPGGTSATDTAPGTGTASAAPAEGAAKASPMRFQKVASATATPKPVTLGNTPKPAAAATPRPGATGDAPQGTSPRPPPVAPRTVAAGAKPASATAALFGDSDDEPISIDPESMRPPSPSPGITRARALSAGTLGSARKPPAAPRPPTPKKAPPVPELSLDSSPESGTPSLHALAAPLHETEKSPEDVFHMGAPPGEPLAASALDLAAALAGPEVLDLSPSDVAVTEPIPTKAAAEESDAETKPMPQADKPTAATVVSKAPAEKRRSPVPMVVGVALAAAIAVVALRGRNTAPSAEPPREPPRAAEPSPPAAEPVKAATPPTPEPVAEPSTSPASNETAAGAVPATAAPPAAAAPEPKGAERALPKTLGAEATPKAETPAPASKEAPAKEAATKAPAATAAPEKKEEAPAAPPPREVESDAEFDTAAATAALGAAAAQAASCRKEGDPSGVATVHVTFSNSGNATRALIEGPPFAGTPTGGCIAAALRRAHVPPYGGDRVTVTKRVVIQ